MNPANPAPASSGSAKIAILFGAVVALLAANIYLFIKLDSVQNDLAEFRNKTDAELISVKESSSVSLQTARRNLSSLRDELEAARRQAAMAVGQAKSEANKHAEQLANRLATEQTKYERAQQQFQQELTQVSEAATTAHTKLGEMNTEVSAVKTEVAANKSELEKTIAELKSVRGDMGVQSGLIATNSTELDALRSLGERNYFEFSITKAKRPSRVGDVSILLKKADPKKNRFTIELVADDKKVEKKDRNVNEPLQFYMAKARQPYEMVVNEVKKDQIVGYLAAPKVQSARK